MVQKIDLSDPVGPTDGLIYQITVSNDGPSDAQGVQVVDTLDANVTFASASPECLTAANEVTCNIGTLPAGQSVNLLIAVNVNDIQPPVTLTNYAAVSTTTTDPDEGNNNDTEETSVEDLPGPSADVAITKSADPTSVFAGQNANYTLNITNNGPQVATNVRVLDIIPFGTTVVSLTAVNPDDGDAYCSASGSCYLGTMNVSTAASVQMVLQVNPDYQDTTLVNTAHVMSDQADTDPSNNITDASVDVSTSADIEIDKTDLVDPVNAGEIIHYEINVTNHGPSDAQDVEITDGVPANTTFVSASADCSLNFGAVICSLGTIPAGETSTVMIQVKVDQSVPDNTDILNTSTVTSSTDDPVPSNNEDSETTTAIQSPYSPTDLSITKGDNPDPVTAGQNLLYTLVVTNNGPAPATSVQVIDLLPSGVTYVGSSSTKGACSSGVHCLLGDMAVDEIVTITIEVNVDSDQTSGLSNFAFVTSLNPDSNPDNNDADEFTSVELSADLSVVKNS